MNFLGFLRQKYSLRRNLEKKLARLVLFKPFKEFFQKNHFSYEKPKFWTFWNFWVILLLRRILYEMSLVYWFWKLSITSSLKPIRFPKLNENIDSFEKSESTLRFETDCGKNLPILSILKTAKDFLRKTYELFQEKPNFWMPGGVSTKNTTWNTF